MKKIPFEDATLIEQAYIEIDGVKHYLVSEQVSGGTDLNANTFNELQDDVEDAIGEAKQQDIITNGEAVKCGYKIDGKDVYVQRFSKKLANAGIVYIDTGLNNATLLKFEGVDTNGTEYHPLPMVDNTDNHSYEVICWIPTISQINIKTISDRSSYTAYVNIYFTYND